MVILTYLLTYYGADNNRENLPHFTQDVQLLLGHNYVASTLSEMPVSHIADGQLNYVITDKHTDSALISPNGKHSDL